MALCTRFRLQRDRPGRRPAPVRRDGVQLQSAETSRRFEIPAASVQVALAALEDRHILRRDLDDAARYRLVDPFLAAWLHVAQGI